MSKTFFTSDWHLGDDRIGINGKPNLFYRPFKSLHEQNATILNNFFEVFEDGDTLYHLGDVFYKFDTASTSAMSYLRSCYPNSKFYLIRGNYDEGHEEYLETWFDNIFDSGEFEFDFGWAYINHYPTKAKNRLSEKYKIGLTGHIHGLWKVQKELINVGVDAWHFKPICTEQIEFCFNAMVNFYDDNVFPYSS